MVVRPHAYVVASLILIAGCGDTIDEGVAFESLPGGDVANATEVTVAESATIATADPVAASIQQTGYSTDVDAPPTELDPFAAETIEQTAAKTPSPFEQPVPGSRDLTPMERMLQQRAAAIAKANGQTFDPNSITEMVDDSPREMKLLIAENSFRVEGPEQAIRVTFDDLDLLKVLNMAPVPIDAADHFPEWLRELHGKKVRVRGFMYPTMREDNIKKFRIARDNDICCFVKTPKIYDTARVEMKEGVTASYIQNIPFDVVGTFHISPKSEFGELFELWRIDDAVIIKKR